MRSLHRAPNAEGLTAAAAGWEHPKASCSVSSWLCSTCSRKALWNKIFLHHFREEEGSEPSLALLAESRTGSDRLGPEEVVCCLPCSAASQELPWTQNSANTQGRALGQTMDYSVFKRQKTSLNSAYLFPLDFPLNMISCFKVQHKFRTVLEDIFIQTVKRIRQDQSDQHSIFRQVSFNPFFGLKRRSHHIQ